VGAAIPVTSTNVATPPPAQNFESQSQPKTSTSVKSFSSITGLGVYDTEAKRVGVVKEMGIQPDQSSIVLVVTKNDGTDVTIKWDEIRKIGEIVLLGSTLSENNLKCMKCNYTNSQGSKFCESCGNKLK
jgi:sporulation protein YlmC with PRC-barrel domain